MNILIIQSAPESNLISGEEVAIRNDINYLRSMNNNVHFEIIRMPKKTIFNALVHAGGLIWSFKNSSKIEGLITKYSPDIIHFHTLLPFTSLSVIQMASKMKVPVIQTLHNGRWLCLEGAYFRNNTYCNDCVGSYGVTGLLRGCGHGRTISLFLFLNNFFFRKFEFLFSKINHFIAVSDFVKNQHVNSNFPENKITVRNNGFNFDKLTSEIEVDNMPIIKKNGIVFAGRVSIAKGALVLKYLIPKLQYPIKIIGNGPELSKLKFFCKDHSLNHVKFFDRLDNEETIKIIKNSVLTIIPSQCGDSFPTVALESISVGTPIIASNLGGLTDLISDSGAGKLIQYDDKEKFLDEINTLISNPEALMKMSHAGQKYVEKNISLNKQGSELFAIYNQVIKQYNETKN